MKGFTLLEVLVALLILAVAYTVLLNLHSLSLHTYSRARDLFSAVTDLELFFSGEPVEGVKVERHEFEVKGIRVEEVIYSLARGNETAYFRIYERR